MNLVEIRGAQDFPEFCDYANRHQDQYIFTSKAQPGTIPLSFIHDRIETPYDVELMEGVRVYTWQSQGIATYSGIPHEHYLLCWAMLGLIQWRSLLLNPLLRPEDFLHSHPSDCLYAGRLFIEDYALAFESPHVCNACLHFYSELCPKLEVEALKNILHHAHPQRHPFYSSL